MTGPIRLMAIGFEKGRFEEENFCQLKRLEDTGYVRLIYCSFTRLWTASFSAWIWTSWGRSTPVWLDPRGSHRA